MQLWERRHRPALRRATGGTESPTCAVQFNRLWLLHPWSHEAGVKSKGAAGPPVLSGAALLGQPNIHAVCPDVTVVVAVHFGICSVAMLLLFTGGTLIIDMKLYCELDLIVSRASSRPKACSLKFQSCLAIGRGILEDFLCAIFEPSIVFEGLLLRALVSFSPAMSVLAKLPVIPPVQMYSDKISLLLWTWSDFILDMQNGKY